MKFYQPHQNLQKYIQCYWLLDRTIEPHKILTQKIISDGSNGLIFNLASSVDIAVDGKVSRGLKGVLLTGATIKPTYLMLKNRVKMIGIRFNMGGSYPFFEKSISSYMDSVIEFQDDAWKRVEESLDEENMVECLDDFLLEQLLPHRVEESDRILEMIALIFKEPNIKKDDLSDLFDLSHRQLERKFKELLGLSMKQIQALIRVHSSRESIKSNAFSTLTEVGYESNYYDQSHFIKEFKKMTDTTPKKYQKEKSGLS
jgi:AraC-like DNA-binding protein